MLRRVKYTLQVFSIQQREYSVRKSAKKSSTWTEKKAKEEAVEVPLEEPLQINFLVRSIGSNYTKWNTVLKQHPELKTLKRKEIVNTADFLKKLNFDVDDIFSKPMILYYNSMTLENRHNVLRECGFELITISLLAKYVTAMNKTVSFLKGYGYIPFATDVVARLKSCFTDLELQVPANCKCREEMELKELRQNLLNCYFRQRLDMSNSHIEKLWKVYSRVRHKSFFSIQSMVQVLLNDLQFSKERITKNAFLLHADVENVRRILKEIPMIDGHDIKEIVYRRPKILMSSCDALLKTLEHIKSYGIGEDAVFRCLDILTLGPDTVLERLRDLNEIEEFKVLGTNPRVLRLVHYQNKARVRLEYLNQLKVRCASLHILSCASETFAKFARDGSDRTKGRDIVVFLSRTLKKDENDVRGQLTRHPNWCHVPVTQVKQCYDFLRNKKFPDPAIYNNIQILLYPIKRIEEKMSLLQTPEYLEDLQLQITSIHTLDNQELLTLILYLIECEYHFTGDGIWTEHHTQPVENFHNLLPDFPESLNKVYKYGVRPADSKTKVVMQT